MINPTEIPTNRTRPVALHRQLRLALVLAAALPTWVVATLAGWDAGRAGLAALAALALALALGEPIVRAVRRQESEPAPSDAAAVEPVAGDAPAKPAGDIGLPAPREQMLVVYRPLCPVAPDQPAGVEAALRWQHPERGLLPADPWLPEGWAARERLCSSLLDTACRQFVAWGRERGADAPSWLALSLPAVLLDMDSLGRVLPAVLQAVGLPADRVRLVVPARLAGHIPVLPPTALGLRAQGIGLLLDDFGSGPTSLAQLGQMPVDAVRIDRSFVERAAEGATQRMVIESTVRVAASLGMVIVADGIASPEQVQAMAALGCHYAQGSGCGPWQPAEDPAA